MLRGICGIALVLTLVVGCGTSDPNEINNTIGKEGPDPSLGPEYKDGAGAQQTSSPYGGGGGYPGESKPADAPAPGDEAKPADAPKDEAKPADETKKDEAPQTASITLSDDELAQIKKLPEAEQAVALAQKICPVGSEAGEGEGHLGSMGKPVKVSVKTESGGRDVFLCCNGCKEDLMKDVNKYLAKLPK